MLFFKTSSQTFQPWLGNRRGTPPEVLCEPTRHRSAEVLKALQPDSDRGKMGKLLSTFRVIRILRILRMVPRPRAALGRSGEARLQKSSDTHELTQEIR